MNRHQWRRRSSLVCAWMTTSNATLHRAPTGVSTFSSIALRDCSVPASSTAAACQSRGIRFFRGLLCVHQRSRSTSVSINIFRSPSWLDVGAAGTCHPRDPKLAIWTVRVQSRKFLTNQLCKRLVKNYEHDLYPTITIHSVKVFGFIAAYVFSITLCLRIG